MPQVSKIRRLPPEIRAEVDRLIREERTVEEIVTHLRSLGGEASASSVYRYTRSARKQLEKFRQAQEVAKVWVARMGEEPNGDVAQLNVELLRTIAFQVVSDMGDRLDEIDTGDRAMQTMLLGKAFEHISKAERHSQEIRLRVRRELARDLEMKVDAAAAKPLTAEGFKALVREAYGG